MSDGNGGRRLDRLAADVVWRQTRALFLTAALLRLMNISFGFIDAVMAGSIPR